MSALTDRLRARAEKPETRAQYAGSDALYDIGFGPICDAVDWAILAAHHANLALDLREAADRIDATDAHETRWYDNAQWQLEQLREQKRPLVRFTLDDKTGGER
jgi:hypothetical protein